MTPPQDREPLPTYVQDLPPLPPEYWEAIRDGLASMPDAGLSESGLETIADHVRLLLAWNAAINFALLLS